LPQEDGCLRDFQRQAKRRSQLREVPHIWAKARKVSSERDLPMTVTGLNGGVTPQLLSAQSLP
jgi:hypothetical protein